MSDANPLWGAPRIHGELLKLGIDVSQATVAKYMPRRQRPPSPTWRSFLANHAAQIVAADFFVVPTVRYRLLFVLVILSLDRRRLVHMAVTAHPTSAWTAQQLREAFPNNEAPRFLLHDRDSAFAAVDATIGGMGIRVASWYEPELGFTPEEVAETYAEMAVLIVRPKRRPKPFTSKAVSTDHVLERRGIRRTP